jgi:dynein heavy chain
LYNKLYRFDQNEELKEHISVFAPDKLKLNFPQKKIEAVAPRESEDDSKENIEDLEIPRSQFESEAYNVDECFTELFKINKKFKLNKIQNAMYEDKEVREHMRLLITGGDAIAFFAKYGNTTPIKFIHCVRSTKEEFNPYKLLIVHNINDLARVNEYFTVSPSGIVHIFSNYHINKKEHFMSKIPTEFISLSDWMRESTLFNILSNIDFFKNYLATKFFKSWRENVKKLFFHKTRERIRHQVFFCKPGYISSVMEIKGSLSNSFNLEMINFSQCQQKQVEFEEFKAMQKEVRVKVSKELENIFEEVASVLRRLVNKVKATQLENSQAGDEGFSMMKQKPLNLIKKEKEERKMRKRLSEEDLGVLTLFIKFINYVALELLIETNRNSVLRMEEEIYKERKNGLFTTSPLLEENGLNFVHKEDDIINAIDSIFDENIKMVREISKTLGNSSFEQLLKSHFIVNHFNFGMVNPDIQQIIITSQDFKYAREKIKEKIIFDFSECRRKVDANYSHCKRIEQERLRFKVDDWVATNPVFEDVRARLLLTIEFRKESGDKIKDYFFGILHVDSKIMRNILTSFATECLAKVKDYLYGLTITKVDETLRSLTKMNEHFSQGFDSLGEYADFIKGCRNIKISLESISAEKTNIDNMFWLLKQSGHVFIIEDKSKLDEISKLRDRLKNEVPQAEDLIKARREEFIQKLNENLEVIRSKTDDLYLMLQSEDLRKAITPISEVMKKLNILKERLDKLDARYKSTVENANLMEANVDETSVHIPLLIDIFERKKETWETYERFFRLYEEWFEGNIKKQNSDNTFKEVQSFEIICKRLKSLISEQTFRAKKDFANLAVLGNGVKADRSVSFAGPYFEEEDSDEVLAIISSKVNNMKELMPLLSVVCNKSLKDKHWLQILELIEGGSALLGKSSITFQELVSLGAKSYIEKLEEISLRASGEASIENDMDKIKAEWLEAIFTVIPYRGSKEKFLISGVGDMFEKLEDNLLKIQSMLGSKFSSDIKEALRLWEKKLSLVHETLDEWVTFQQQWMYLENVFSTEDIQRQLPAEYAKFHGVDKFWKETMARVQKKPAVLEHINGGELLARFIESNKQLEIIQKLLEDYLELKRKMFPRFFFLSNEELLEIFSQTRNPEAIQPHLRKCFDNLKAIQFKDDEEEKETIVAMVSAEPDSDKEIVPFESPVIASGSIELWLVGIEKMMQQTLKARMKDLLTHLGNFNGLLDFEKIFNFPAQIVLAVNLIRWTNYFEIFSPQQKLINLLSLIKEQIIKSVQATKTELTVGQRQLIKNLITTDVHSRDVIEELIKINAQVTDFDWEKQLRYYWESSKKISMESEVKSPKGSTHEVTSSSNINVDSLMTCLIRQTSAVFEYGFEYLGNSPRLVITPLTEKCYVTLTSALQLIYGGAPAGPAGTGKTETTKDLAKAVAIVCIVFNCSDSLEYRTMGRFFSGLAQCGAWACFDEFNRIGVEVLSVIAQQVLIIQNAMKERREEFDFEGKIISLNRKFGVFITMNPGYAGRSELPDNLKALFRPVAMMIPDYSLIAEIVMFSEGFLSVGSLAKKLVHLFRLSSEQLSAQKHYDFGMRAVKSVLSTAGLLRRRFPDASDEEILLKSIRDSNLPKFLVRDLPLFEGLISDLFTSESRTIQLSSIIFDFCKDHLASQNLSTPDSYMLKIKQIYEVCEVRHGIMTVGKAYTGKTKAMEALVHGIEQNGEKVELFKINPKSVSLNELFGFNDPFTNTFVHGIGGKLFTSLAESPSGSRKWIVFDGPVDAGWIENMNTVLDDNKMLCLPDGKRIKLGPEFATFFEVENLDRASPATVSRCGMVYFDENTLEPNYELKRYLQELESKVKERVAGDPKYKFLVDCISEAEFWEFLSVTVKETIDFIVEQGEQMVQTPNMALVRGTTRLFSIEFDKFLISYFKKLTSFKLPSELDKFIKSFELRETIRTIWFFALIWSTGANLSDKAKQQFSKKFKINALKRTGSLLVHCTEITDFFYDSDRLCVAFWKELISDPVLTPSTKFSDILVDTTETVAVKFNISNLISQNFPVLLNGPTGMGKTAVIKAFLYGLNNSYSSLTCSFSAQSDPKSLRSALEEKLSQRGKDLAPTNGKQLILFIDDVNMPRLDTYGSQPVNELVRQILDQGGYYDLKKYVFRSIKGVSLITACAPPEGGRSALSQRLVRHFHCLSISEISEKSLEHIFGSIIRGFFDLSGNKKFTPTALNSLVVSSIKVYKETANFLLPTPKKCHYCFNLRDLSKVFQGMLNADIKSIDSEEGLYALWLHEKMRVFSDRFIEDADKNFFYEKLQRSLPVALSFSIDKLEKLRFTDFIGDKYALASENELSKLIVEAVKDISATDSRSGSIVIFSDVIKHICRIKRILSFSKGHALLLGINGLGKQSLARLSSHMAKTHTFSIEVTRSYKFINWREDLKKVIRLAAAEAGLDGRKGATFIISDSQLVSDTS